MTLPTGGTLKLAGCSPVRPGAARLAARCAARRARVSTRAEAARAVPPGTWCSARTTPRARGRGDPYAPYRPPGVAVDPQALIPVEQAATYGEVLTALGSS